MLPDVGFVVGLVVGVPPDGLAGVLQCGVHGALLEQVLAHDEALALLALDFGEQVPLAFFKFLVLELAIQPIAPHLVETVHVQLHSHTRTCLTKLEKLECLK